MRTEHRKSKRRFIAHGARIASGDNSEPENCHIVDISPTGARLKVASPGAVPDNLILLLSYDGRLQRQCAVVWRAETEIGVEFLPDRPD